MAIPKKFRNNYVIEGDITKIELHRRDGTTKWTIIDTEDLQRLIDFKYTWIANYRERNGDWYACTAFYAEIDGEIKHSTIRLHGFIMNTYEKENIHVDHINHDGLDNRKSNLRITTVSENDHNRKSKNITNTSGYRNVSPSKNRKWWVVTLRINKKVKELARFSDVDDAGEYAEKMRQKYYGDYAGES
jgi:hypothetical protein